MTPFTYFRIAATLVEAVSEVKKIKADGIVTVQEVLESALLLAERAEIDTLIMACTDTARVMAAASQLVTHIHEMLVKDGEINLGDALRSALKIAQHTGIANRDLSQPYQLHGGYHE